MSITINGYVVTETTTFEFAPNPKRVHAKVHGRYANYSKATNLVEYQELSEEYDGHQRNIMPSLRYDESHGYLKLIDDEGNHINSHEE